MNKLSHEASQQFWREFMGGSIYHIIDFIENTESWVTKDDSSVNEALGKLEGLIDKITESSNLDPKHLVSTCALLHLSQKLRVMQLSDTAAPGLATKMIKAAEQSASEDESCYISLQRNLIFERMRIIERILSPQRIQLVQKLYEA